MTVTGPAAAGGLCTAAEVVNWANTGTCAAPNVTITGGEKPVPVRVTGSPPSVEPTVAESWESVGGGGVWKVKAETREALPPSPLRTVTSTAPAAWAGQVAVIEVALATATEVPGAPPNATVAPAWKPAPVSVTAVPPPTGQEAGKIAVRESEGVPPPRPPPQAASASETSTAARRARSRRGGVTVRSPRAGDTRSRRCRPAGTVSSSPGG